MSAETILAGTIRPVLSYLWTEHRIPNGPAAEAMMLAIGLQESRFEHRDQLEMLNGRAVPGAVGPATGFWQFEKNGGVAGVMGHHLTADIARQVATAAGVPWDRDAIWRALATEAGDQLAAAFARLLLYTDPAALPAAAEAAEEEAFSYYLRNWRPGAWTRGTDAQKAALRAKWGNNWRRAVEMVGGGAQPAALVQGGLHQVAPDALAALEARVLRLERKLAAIADAAG